MKILFFHSLPYSNISNIHFLLSVKECKRKYYDWDRREQIQEKKIASKHVRSIQTLCLYLLFKRLLTASGLSFIAGLRCKTTSSYNNKDWIIGSCQTLTHNFGKNTFSRCVNEIKDEYWNKVHGKVSESNIFLASVSFVKEKNKRFWFMKVD